MKPIVIIGGTFLLWLALNKRIPLYAALVNKNSSAASNSPTSFDASATPVDSSLAGVAAAGANLLKGAFGASTGP